MKTKLMALITCVVLLISILPVSAFAGNSNDSAMSDDIVILYENDVHCVVEGYSKIAALKTELQETYAHVGVVSGGDFVQGNSLGVVSKGQYIVELMNLVGYDAVTLGNHEFDNGIDSLAARLHEATFKVVCTNYEVSGTPLEDVVKKTVIFSRAGWKIGVIGLGVNPEGLILKSNFGDVQYLEPIAVANHYADSLKQHCGCDVVVALSHLGSAYDTENIEPCDEYLAQNSSSIDIIMGGHTHKQVCKKCVNLKGDSVLLIQSGKSGAYLGKVKLTK